MAVQRAWVDNKGNVMFKLTNEQMSQFMNKVVSGLNDLAQSRVIEEQARKPDGFALGMNGPFLGVKYKYN